VVQSLAAQAINAGLYNIYDPYSTPQDVLNSISATISRDSFFTTKEAYGHVTFNDLFELGGGAAGLVVGAEYREEDYGDAYDSLSAAGVVLGSAGASSGESRQVSAVYGELLLPITSAFELNFAGRWEDYSDYGSNFAPKISARFQPIDSLTLRASVGRGFVAPTLDIISQATAFSADSVRDPANCLANGDINPAQIGPGKPYADAVAYCAATGGRNGVQVDSYREKAVGLGAEESTQYAFGVVWDAAEWLNFTVDVYSIEIEDRIAFYSSQKLINIDIGDDPTPFPGAPCSLIRDTSTTTALGNPLSEIHNCYYNEGEVKTRGADLSVRTNFDFGEIGALKNQLMVTYIDSYKIDGGEQQVGLQGFPEMRATLQNMWSYGDLDLGWNVRYIGDNGEGGTETASFTTHDLQVSYKTPWNGKVTLGVNNVGDKLPELVGYDGRPFNFYLYDAYGRTPYFRYEQNF
jgi:iron complex outermembrane receptor protein